MKGLTLIPCGGQRSIRSLATQQQNASIDSSHTVAAVKKCAKGICKQMHVTIHALIVLYTEKIRLGVSINF